MNETILIIDDDQKLNTLLIDYLAKFGFNVKAVTHPESGFKSLKRALPDLIILDVMLPGMDGFEVCKKIRKEHTIPIIMLTARGEVTDRIVGLELGADDYLPKPFEPRELAARIQTILRRTQGEVKQEIRKFDVLSVDFTKRSVLLKGKHIDLTNAEFEILSLFIKNAGKVLNRDQILDEARGIEWDSFNRSVDVLISRLRQKLYDDPKNPDYLKTVWGAGYMFIGEEVGDE